MFVFCTLTRCLPALFRAGISRFPGYTIHVTHGKRVAPGGCNSLLSSDTVEDTKAVVCNNPPCPRILENKIRIREFDPEHCFGIPDRGWSQEENVSVSLSGVSEI